MGASELEILISAVDEASAPIAEIGESMDGLAADVSDSVTAMNASLAEFGLTMDATTGEITDALLTQEQSFALAAQIAQQSDEEIIDQMIATGSTAQEAAADIAEANALISSSGEEASTTSAGAYAGLAAVAGIAFLALKSAIGDAVSSAMAWDETSAQVAQILKDTGSSIPLSQITAYAQQVQGLTLFSQQDVLASEALIVSHTQLQGSYQETTMMAADLATKMDTDLPNATRMLTNALTDPVAGLNQLIRQGNIDFPASAVTMIDSLAEAGDTAGADAVIMQTLSGSIGGLATAAAGAPGAALTQLGNQMTALGTVIGNDLLPLLDAIAKYMGPVIQAIETWTAAHPKLTDAIVIGTLALTALLLIVGLIGVAIITITPVVALLTTVFGALSVAAALPLLPFILLGAAIVLLATLIIVNWTNLKDDMEAIGQAISADWDASWNSIYSFGQNIIGQIKNFIHTEMTDVANDWNAIWTGIANFFSNIWSTIVNGLKSDINNVISLINGLISAIDALHISIPAITIPGTKIGTPAVNIGFDIPQIPALASGGIVSVPTVALIGEGGPEAVVPLSSSSFGGVGGGGAPTQIVINIQGGNYLDQNGATMIGNALAKQIIQQIRVKNYAL